METIEYRIIEKKYPENIITENGTNIEYVAELLDPKYHFWSKVRDRLEYPLDFTGEQKYINGIGSLQRAKDIIEADKKHRILESKKQSAEETVVHIEIFNI